MPCASQNMWLNQLANATRSEFTMHTFFRGWRRKAGVVSLVMALAFCGAWVRSRGIRDEITIHGSPSRQTAVSMDGFVTWSRFGPNAIKRQVTWISEEITPKLRKDHQRHGSYDWKWECCGFLFGAMTTETMWWSRGITFTSREDYWQVPYWSATVPLTLLSAWLILIPARKRPTTVSQPHA